MSQRYLLKCECGIEHPVETAQAGDTLPCSCGRTVSIPSFRELRQLPPAAAGGPPKKAKRAWHPLQGLLFGVGSVMFTVWTVWGVSLEIHRRVLDLEEDPRIQQELQRNLKNIGKLKIHESYEVWKLIQQRGLGRRQPPPYVLNRELNRYWLSVEIQMFLAALVGVVLIVVSLVIRPGQKRRGQRPASRPPST